MTEKQLSPEKRKPLNGRFSLIVFIIAAILMIYLIATHLVTFVNVMTVVLGFGAVILVHEFGHFIVAKLSGIKVEAFSIGFPPTMLSIRKTGGKVRFSVLPKLFGSGLEEAEGEPKSEVPDGVPASQMEAKMADTKTTGIAITKGQWETEYRIGLVPFGGFVKMLGQEDAGPAGKTDNPRSYANKPISVRIAVVAAGVIFNVISAFLIFLVVFSMGMKLPPAVVGGIQADSPAEKAGVRPGDRIVEINGEDFVDFTSVILAPALSVRGEEIEFKLRHLDGTEETVNLVAAKAEMSAMNIRTLGIDRAGTLTIDRRIDDPEDVDILYELTGLRPGDVVTAIEGEPVEYAWQFEEILGNTLKPKAAVTVLRTDPETKLQATTNVDLPLYWPVTNENFQTEFDLCHVYSMIPRIRIRQVFPEPKNLWERAGAFLFGWKDDESENKPTLMPGDIIVKIGTVQNPTYKELRGTTILHKDKEMPITVLRGNGKGQEELVIVVVTPKAGHGMDRVTFGIIPELDIEHTVVADTTETDNIAKLNIPRGARIVAVDGQQVQSFNDIARIIRANPGQRISIDYRIDDENAGGDAIKVPEHPSIVARTALDVGVPFEALKEVYKADGPVQALGMGMKKTYQFIAQTYVTLSRLFSGDVGADALSGPVGIVSASYSIAKRSLIDYIYFLGLISSCIAVMNLLPLPIVDGGVIVLLIIEKIKGSPINERVQEIISYAGLAFILSLILWLTYNDIRQLWLR